MRKLAYILLFFLILLPPYQLSMALLFKYSQSVPLIEMVRPWKESIALLGLTLITLSFLLKLKIKQFHFFDKCILVFFFLNLLYLFVPWGQSFEARLYGLRANAFFVIIYFLGRYVPLSTKRQRQVLILIVGIGVSACLVAIFEIIALPNNWPVKVGVMDYLHEFYGVSPIGHYGLTWSFETATGLRRRSAFFANPLELASSTLLTGPAALYLVFYYRRKTWGHLLASIAFGMIVLSLLLTVSRASLMAFIIQLLVIVYWLKRPNFGMVMIATIFIGIIGIFIVGGSKIITFVSDTITFENPSSQGHLREWITGGEAILENPQGLGLGSSGHTGARFGMKVGGENQYVITGVDLGIFGLMLYIFILFLAIRYPFKAFHQTTGVTKALTFVTAVSQLGLLIPSFTSNIQIYIFITYITWWLVGFSIQILMKQSAMPNPHANVISKDKNVAYSY